VPVTFDDLRRPPLDQAALAAALCRPGSVWEEVVVLDAVPSTNAVVADRARAGAAEGLVVVAEHQTAGRGRLDRIWVTPPGAALTMSVLLQPEEVDTGRWPWLPILAGIAVSEAVQRVCDVACELKWPNDVLVSERKLAGILVERIELESSAAAVVGIGLNVSTIREELPGPAATSLALEGAATLDRSVIAREMLRSLGALYRQWRAEHGDAALGLLGAYARRCSTLGRHVRVELPTGRQVSGEATGVDADGRLQVRTDRGTEALSAGDVVHLRVEGGVP